MQWLKYLLPWELRNCALHQCISCDLSCVAVPSHVCETLLLLIYDDFMSLDMLIITLNWRHKMYTQYLNVLGLPWPKIGWFPIIVKRMMRVLRMTWIQHVAYGSAFYASYSALKRNAYMADVQLVINQKISCANKMVVPRNPAISGMRHDRLIVCEPWKTLVQIFPDAWQQCLLASWFW